MIARLVRARFEQLGGRKWLTGVTQSRLSSTISELSSRVIAASTNLIASDARFASRLDDSVEPRPAAKLTRDARPCLGCLSLGRGSRVPSCTMTTLPVSELRSTEMIPRCLINSCCKPAKNASSCLRGGTFRRRRFGVRWTTQARSRASTVHAPDWRVSRVDRGPIDPRP